MIKKKKKTIHKEHILNCKVDQKKSKIRFLLYSFDQKLGKLYAFTDPV